MPQFDISQYFTQLFWLVIFFNFLYFYSYFFKASLKIQIKNSVEFLLSNLRSRFGKFKRQLIKEYKFYTEVGKGPLFLSVMYMYVIGAFFIMSFLIISFLEWMGWYH